MQAAVIFGIITAVTYLLANLALNRFSEEKKTLKTIGRESCLVFLSVLATNFISDTLGFSTFTIKQKGGAATAAFTSKPEF